MVAEAWLIWGMIGRFKAFKVTLGLLVAITLAEETVGAEGMALVIALIGAFLVLLSLGRLATGGYASARHCSLLWSQSVYLREVKPQVPRGKQRALHT